MVEEEHERGLAQLMAPPLLVDELVEGFQIR